MRNILSSDNLHFPIKDQTENYHTDIVREVASTVAENKVVVVGMRYNDSVYTARRALKKADIEFTYLEYGSYFSQWRRRLALKMWTGWPTFPMIFMDGILVGGSKDLRKILKEKSKLSQLNN
jgi:monothiol glutaredoxin